MTWLAPLWIAALASLAIPVLIHLRRQRIGRRIQVGSVRHLTGAATPRRRRLRIREPWLLALRCGVLAALVLALAGPALLRQARPARWVLVAPTLTGAAAQEIAPLLDSLARTGASLRLLAHDFPPARPGRTAPAPDSQPDLWSLLRAADAELAPGSSVVVVTPPELGLLHGIRPTLATAVTIRSADRRPDDTLAVEAAWRHGDSVSRIVTRRMGGGAIRTMLTRPAGAPDAPIPLADSLTVRIVADSTRRDDARYLQAAFAAAAGAFGVRVRLETLAPAALDLSRVGPRDWTAWLGGSPPPNLPGAWLADAGASAPRRTDDVSASDRPVDAFGRPLLVRSGSTAAQSFAGRFNPRFGDLVLEPGFPRIIAQLWAATALGMRGSPLHDLRSVSPSQLAPATGTTGRPTGRLHPLRNLLLALCAALFLAERWLAYRRR